jgi:hypothetical protein
MNPLGDRTTRPGAHPAHSEALAGPTTLDRTAGSAPLRSDVVAELPLYRLHLMRVGYLVLGLGNAVVRWPTLVHHGPSWPLMDGVVTCILIAMSLLAFLGLRHPVRLLPILVFESAWKLLWLSAVALPQLAAGDMDAATREVASSCLWVVLILAVVPWRYVWQQYVVAKGDRWR